MTTIAESIADWLAAASADRLPGDVVETSQKLFLDVAGLYGEHDCPRFRSLTALADEIARSDHS